MDGIQAYPAAGAIDFRQEIRASSPVLDAVTVLSPVCHIGDIHVIHNHNPNPPSTGAVAILDHLLQTAQAYERKHGKPPEVVYINPYHFETLFRYHPEWFSIKHSIPPGFRLLIVPGSRLTHPESAVLTTTRPFSQAA